jgi:hypothetical protein
MNTRAFQGAADINTNTIKAVALVYNHEEEARRDGYHKTNFLDQFGYTVWKHFENKNNRAYYLTDYALVLPINF